MIDKRKLFLNYALFLTYALFAVSFQTSLWMQLLSGFPPPHFWVPVLAFWSLYRSPKEGLAMAYLLTLVVGSVTAIPLGLFMLINLVLFLSSYFFKLKFYQPGAIFYAIVCGGMSVAFLPIHWFLSLLIESSPIVELEIFYWLIQSLLTPLLALFLYPVFVFLDDLTNKQLPTETGRQFG